MQESITANPERLVNDLWYVPSYPTPDLTTPKQSASAHLPTNGTGIDKEYALRLVPATVRMYVDELEIAAKLYIASI